MEEQERVRAQTEQQELTQTQQQETPQAHWERTARVTREMVAVQVLEVEEPMAASQETVVPETTVVQVEIQDQI